LRQRSEKCAAEGSKYAHWLGLHLSFNLSLVLSPFIHGRLQNLETSEHTSGHDITVTPLTSNYTGKLALLMATLYYTRVCSDIRLEHDAI